MKHPWPRLDLNVFEILIPYTKEESPLVIKCKKCSNIKRWKQAKNCRPNYSCGQCNYHRGKYKKELVIETCKNHNIIFLDNHFRLVTDKYNFQCQNGHTWNSVFSELLKSFKKNRNGCRECFNNTLKIKKDVVIERLLKRNIILQEGYKNSKTKHLLKCNLCNHEWLTTLEPIFNRDVGCPKCKMWYNQKLTGKYIKELLPNCTLEDNYTLKEKIFHKNEIIRNHLFIDYRVEFDTKIIYIEYNGPHHYTPTNYRNHKPSIDLEKKFYTQTIRDSWIREYCKTKNIILIEVDGRLYTKESIKDFLHQEFIRNKIILRPEF